MKNVKERMDICFDSKAPSIVVEIDAYRNGYKDIRNRRAFTEITNDNLRYQTTNEACRRGEALEKERKRRQLASIPELVRVLISESFLKNHEK